jgi:hypothetical protein
MLNYAEMVEALRRNICRVTFTKVDGTNRVMFATLKSEIIPEGYEFFAGNQALLTEGDGDHEKVSVWDTHINEWRSFRVSSVIEFTEYFGRRKD